MLKTADMTGGIHMKTMAKVVPDGEIRRLILVDNPEDTFTAGRYQTFDDGRNGLNSF
ncbi:MAG: hypothetical protein WCH75_07425 [Candidatus Binatia bacterium]